MNPMIHFIACCTSWQWLPNDGGRPMGKGWNKSAKLGDMREGVERQKTIAPLTHTHNTLVGFKQNECWQTRQKKVYLRLTFFSQSSPPTAHTYQLVIVVDVCWDQPGSTLFNAPLLVSVHSGTLCWINEPPNSFETKLKLIMTRWTIAFITFAINQMWAMHVIRLLSLFFFFLFSSQLVLLVFF